jgi:phosphopantothenoylcysteine decarboxylase/phosphopantothenate--cysteine ligase
MLHLNGRKILLGVCGSIAAYKVAFLVRLLKAKGAEVRVVMTTSALDFITPLTLSTLSENPVLHSFKSEENETWNNHVELGLWADLFVIAPASENTIGKMAQGICDNLLLATYFSARCKVVVCPAMDLDMYAHPATQSNLETLSKNGNLIIESSYGLLASGLEGKGRMEEPENIVAFIENTIGLEGPLKNKKILLTAGPTYEAIDPVRFIGNRSTGKMGVALAREAFMLGAEVHLVCGPIHESLLQSLPKGIFVYRVESADEMNQSVQQLHAQMDIVVFSAAVADYKPESVADEKIKKSGAVLDLHLVKNIDIAAVCGSNKKQNQLHIGFALETNNEKENATEKLSKKNFDVVVLNSLKNKGAGFGFDTNQVTLINTTGKTTEIALTSKENVAKGIWDFIITTYAY